MNEQTDELAFWLSFRRDIAEKLRVLKLELTLASPPTHIDDEHQFLIKKVALLHGSLKVCFSLILVSDKSALVVYF
jgi:hypothetical protein